MFSWVLIAIVKIIFLVDESDLYTIKCTLKRFENCGIQIQIFIEIKTTLHVWIYTCKLWILNNLIKMYYVLYTCKLWIVWIALHKINCNL